MRRFMVTAMLMAAFGAHAGDYTTASIPFRINIIRNEGFMIDGAFGNPGRCTYGDQLFVRINHPQYRLIYDTVLSAYIHAKPIVAYVLSCQDVAWYALPGNTFNVVDDTGSIGLFSR